MTEYEFASAIAKRTREEGGHALFVGGWGRDRILGLASEDSDLEVYGIAVDRLRELLAALGPVNADGKNFTVYKVGPVHVSMPRTESKSGLGHRGFTVKGDPYLPIAEAARRRDFTINAIAWDPLNDNYLDPYGG